MLSDSHHHGFTIVELLVGISLVAVLLAIGAPMLGQYLQNSKVANAASSYYTAVQTARTEAIRRNVSTEFVLTNTDVAASGVENSLTPVASGKNWVVRAASGAGTYVLVEARAGSEGSAASGAAAVVVASSASAIAFNGFGQTTPAGSAFTIDVSNPAAGSCAPSGPVRCRRINVSPGGQVTSCDPVAASGVDSRAC